MESDHSGTLFPIHFLESIQQRHGEVMNGELVATPAAPFKFTAQSQCQVFVYSTALVRTEHQNGRLMVSHGQTCVYSMFPESCPHSFLASRICTLICNSCPRAAFASRSYAWSQT